MSVLAALTVAAGCSRPAFEGPQVQDPPANFMYDANASQGRNAFHDREVLRQGAWFHVNVFNDEEHSSIFITSYPGSTHKAIAEQARAYQETQYGRSIRYGPIEEIRIDDRQAWGWLETQIYRDEVSSLEYKAIVSYDSVTYAIEFFSNEQPWMHPDTLRTTVMTFADGRTRVSLPGLLIVATLGLIVIMGVRRANHQAAVLAAQRRVRLAEAEARVSRADQDRLQREREEKEQAEKKGE